MKVSFYTGFRFHLRQRSLVRGTWEGFRNFWSGSCACASTPCLSAVLPSFAGFLFQPRAFCLLWQFPLPVVLLCQYLCITTSENDRTPLVITSLRISFELLWVFWDREALQKKIHGTNASRRTLETLGVSEKIFYQARSESSSSSATKDTLHEEVCGRRAIKFDDFLKGCVHWEVFLRKVYPTVTAVLQACKENIQDFPAVSCTTLWRLLKSIGFKYKKRSGRRCIHERADVVLKRHHYLCDMGSWGSMGLPSSFAMRRGWTNITPAPGHGRTPPTCELNPIELIRIWAPIKGEVVARNKTASATLRRWANQRSNRTRVARKLQGSKNRPPSGHLRLKNPVWRVKKSFQWTVWRLKAAV